MHRKVTLDIANHFERKLSEHGSSLLALGWNSEASQQNRFNVLASMFGLRPLLSSKFSVLDVGSGFGDFYLYLKKHFPDADYFGIDLAPKMVQEAQKRYPDADFRCIDILKDSVDGFNYVIASGIFSHLTGASEEIYSYIIKMLERMFEICRVGVGVNFLSIYSPTRAPDNCYVDPLRILGMVQMFTPKVALRHDYRINDFTVFMYK